MTGADTLSAPLRLVVPFVVFLIPVVLWTFFESDRLLVKRVGVLFLAILLAWNLFFSLKFRGNDFVEVLNVAHVIKDAQAAGIIGEEQQVLFQKNAMTPYVGDHHEYPVIGH